MNFPSSSEIAIIGMAGRFAGAADMTAFWHNVLGKVDAVHEASDLWAGPFFEPTSKENDRIYTRKGGFLGDQVDFEPSAYGIMPSSVGAGDADHFLSLEITMQALADAGYAERAFDRRNTGIVLGHGTYVNRGYDTLLQHGRIVDQTLELVRQLHPALNEGTALALRTALKASLPPFDAAAIPSLVPNIIAGRIANRLDLQGPNFIVDAACASSLVAIETAVRELTSGRCAMMLAGGVHSSTPPQLYMMFCLLQALSRSNVRPFDDAANGTLLGEGLGVLVLKRLREAEGDGDRIYAIIAGSGTSSDGRALGLLTPRREGQEIALRRAYEESGVDPDSIGLIEAHGTGTPVGDATEVRSLESVFGGQAIAPHRALGSVKSMIGHCISAAGVAGVIKTTLALHDKILPPTLCDRVSESLNVPATSFYVNNEARPWIRAAGQGPRRAGVNAFGFGGVNAHLILEEYTGGQRQEVACRERWASELLVFAADNEASLLDQLRETSELVSRPECPSLASLACSLAGRSRGRQRVALTCRDLAHLQKTLADAISLLKEPGAARLPADVWCARVKTPELGRLALLFPGEGSQYSNMLAELCLCFPSVRRWFDLLDDVFAATGEAPPSLAIFPPPTCWTKAELESANARLFRFDLGSAAVFCASMALHELLQAFGVTGDILVGHSTGEGAALVAGGAIRYDGRAALLAGMRTFYSKCSELERSGQIPEGQLLTVGAIDSTALASILDTSAGRVLLALDNSANQSVLYCESQAMGSLIARIQEQGGVCAKLPFQRAYHTPLFEQLRTTISALYEELKLQAPFRSVYSCATVKPFPAEDGAARDLAARQWFSPVRFRETVLHLYAEGVRTFLEVGPGATLTAFVRDTLGRGKALALSSNHPRRSALGHLQGVLAELFVRGADLDFSPLYACRRLQVLDPTRASRSQERRGMRLDLTMPRVGLTDKQDEVIQLVRDSAARAASEVTPSSGVQTTESGDAAAVPDDQRLTMLRAHFETMSQFLSTQRNVFVHATATVGATPQATVADVSSTREAAAMNARERRWPLLGRVIERTPTHLQCERILDVEQDRFLLDHTLGSHLSTRLSAGVGLPILPLTVTMEMLAEAAQCLLGADQEVTAIREVRAHRWLALDLGRLRVRVSAQLLAGERNTARAVRVLVHEVPGDELAESALVFEGVVHLATAFATNAAASPLPALARRNSTHYSASMLYAAPAAPDWRYAPMFHGRCFQGVRSIDAWDATGIDATFVIRERSEFFRETPAVEFLIDPVMLDCAGQLIGYWVAEHFGVDLTFFPFHVQQYVQHRRPLAAGEEVRCRARIRLATDGAPGQPASFEFITRNGSCPARPDLESQSARRPEAVEGCQLVPSAAALEGEFEFCDARGQIIARVSGWRDRYFSIPNTHYRCHLWPSGAYLSAPCLQDATGQAVRRVQASDYLQAAGQIWKRALAHLVLTRDERLHWYALPERSERRTQWLLGRIAAKDAVRQWAKDRLNLELAPIDVEVRADSDEAPLVSVVDLAGVDLHVAVSISHCGATAMALAYDAQSGRIGIDMEQLGRARIEDLREAAFVPSELNLIQTLPPEIREYATLRLWCAKEAALKSAPPGVSRSPLEWTTLEYSHAGGIARIVNGADRYLVRLFDVANEVVALCHGANDLSEQLALGEQRTAAAIVQYPSQRLWPGAEIGSLSCN